MLSTHQYEDRIVNFVFSAVKTVRLSLINWSDLLDQVQWSRRGLCSTSLIIATTSPSYSHKDLMFVDWILGHAIDVRKHSVANLSALVLPNDQSRKCSHFRHIPGLPVHEHVQFVNEKISHQLQCILMADS